MTPVYPVPQILVLRDVFLDGGIERIEPPPALPTIFLADVCHGKKSPFIGFLFHWSSLCFVLCCILICYTSNLTHPSKFTKTKNSSKIQSLLRWKLISGISSQFSNKKQPNLENFRHLVTAQLLLLTLVVICAFGNVHALMEPLRLVFPCESWCRESDEHAAWVFWKPTLRITGNPAKFEGFGISKPPVT